MEREIRDPRSEGVEGLKGINMQKEDNILSSFANMSLPKYGSLMRSTIPSYSNIKPTEDVGTEEFGLSRYDKEISTIGELADINEARANIQPWYDKIAAGIVKGTVLAANTFADGIAGNIAGVLNVLANVDDIVNSDNPLRELGNQFINNPASTILAQINENMESKLPNYYTKEEQEGPWTDHIFSANFIGDKFLKNMGFTIGAAYNARVAAGLMSKAMGLKGVRDAFKGAVTTASGRTLNTASEIAKAYKSGDAFMDGVKLTEDLGKAAKQLKNTEWKLKTIGAVNSAMGEGRIEAISNSKQWFDYNSKLLEDYKKNQIDAIEHQLWEEHPEWFSIVEVGDGRYVNKIVDPEGQKEWERRKQAIEEQHTEGLKKLAKDRANMANVIFGANVALLSASNLWQYGRFISGGYNTGRQAKNLVKGSIKEGFTANKDIARREYLKAATNPFVEMNEEMSQAFISETTGLKYASEINDFFGAKINPDAEEETAGWLNSIAKGASNTYGNFDRWEEGFLGFLTGALGIPKIGFNRDAQGRRRPSISLEGELWQGIQDARNISKEATSVADALNKRVQSPDFVNYYQGTIRHNKYQNDMEAALDKGDNFDYKNAEHSQFVSDAIMFDKAGRLQDLYDMIDEASNVTIDDVNDIKSMTIDKETGKSLFEGKTDEEVISHIKKQAEDARKKLDSYIKISNDLKTLYGDNISSDHLEELTWMMTQVDDWEGRTKSIISDIQSTIGSKAKEISDRFGIDVNTTLGNLEWVVNHLANDNNVVDEINKIIEDKNISVEEGRARIETLIREKEMARGQSATKLGGAIQHIRKKARLKREELQKRYNRVSERLDELSEKKAEKDELDRLVKEVHDLYNEYSQYGDLKIGFEELRSRVEEMYDDFRSNHYNIDESLKAIEDYLYREVILPLSTLEGKRGQSTWEKNREAMARRRHQEFSESMFSQIVALKDMLSAEEYQTMDPLSVKKISENLIDLIKLYSARSKFISKYTQLAENPELFTAEAQQEINNVLNNIQSKEINKAINGVSAATTIKELREGLSSIDPSLRESVINKLQESENETLKNLANDYKELEESNKILMDIIGGKRQTPETISAANIIKDAMYNANNLEEAKLIIADGINNVDKPIADELLSIMDDYTDHLKSKESNKKDKNKAKKKIKKKGLLDVATDEDSTEDIEEDNGEEESGILSKAGKDEDAFNALQEEEDRPKRKATPDESIKAASKEDLEDISKGKATLQGAEKSKEDADAVKKIAEKELENRKNPPIHSEEEDSTEGNSESNTATKQDTLANYLRSWAVTQYNFNDLKNRDIRRAIQYNDPRVPKLIELGTFEFVDSGRLGDLFNKDNNIPIHYITVSSGPLKNTVLLAIEVTDKVIPINAITAQDSKQYQVVGTLGFNKDNEESTRAYNELVDYLSDERGEDNAQYFVSSMTNKIRHIYSGRMVKSTETDTVRQRPLKGILHGEKPHFGIYYKNGDFRTPTLGAEDEIVPLNENNSNPREGSLWLMTKEADGRYYAKSLKVSRFNSSYDLETNRGTPLVQRIIDDIKDILDPNKSDYQRSLAKYDLEEILYFPEETTLLFNKLADSDEVIVSITGFENNIGAGLDIEEKVEAILDALQSDELDLRFQVSTSRLTDSDYVEDLLNSNILTTDIIQIHNVNASFDMYLPNFETGKPIEDKKPSKGHTGTRGINNEISGDTIIHNGQTYRVTNEGVYKDSEQITDQNTIDEIMFISKIKAGTVNPIEGNSKLYVGAYSSGEQFGVINYNVKTGEELQALLDKAKKENKKASAEDFRSEWERVNSEESTLPYEVTESEQPEGAVESLFEAVDRDESTLPYEVAEEETQKEGSKEDILEKASRREDKEESLMKKGPRLSNSFNPSSTRSAEELNTETETFESLVRANRSVVRELGFKSVSEMIDYINNPANDLPNTDSITSQKAFDSLIDTIKNCR